MSVKKEAVVIVLSEIRADFKAFSENKKNVVKIYLIGKSK